MQENLEGVIREIRIKVTEPPDVGAVLQQCSGVKCGTAFWVVFSRVAIGLVVVFCLAISLQIAATKSKRVMEQLTPLRVINAAWSAADGYVLQFEVYDEFPIGGYDDGTGPNYERFEAAVNSWADAHGFKRPLGEAVRDHTDMGLFVMRTGGASSDGEYYSTQAQVNMRSDDVAVVKELAGHLASLPGVMEPKLQKLTMHFGMGGLTPATENAKVIIDGTSYEFPEDFSQQEAQDLYWAFSSREEGPRIQYWAFPVEFLAERKLRPGSNYAHGAAVDPKDIEHTRRFPLGDVVRMATDANGNFTVDTVVAKWDIPKESFEKANGRSNWKGWALQIPADVDESQLDILKELSRKFAPLPEDRENFRYYARMTFWLYPLEKLKAVGGASVTAEERQDSAALAKQLQSAFDAWKDARPELKRSLVYGDRASSGPQKAGPTTIAFHASVSTDDLAEFDSLRTALSQVSGVPVPRTFIFDRQQGTQEFY